MLYWYSSIGVFDPEVSDFIMAKKFNVVISEGEFQQTIIELAEWHGWDVYHVANVKKHLRSRTSVGFPDLVLLRETVVFAEIKREGKHPTESQKKWIERFKAAGFCAAVWRPSDWPDVMRFLSCKSGNRKEMERRFKHKWE